MAISKLNYNSLNVTPSANAAIGFDSGADDLETGAGGGSINFIKKLTASSSSTLSFVDGSDGVVLDSTYKEYLFTFNNIHPSANQPDFQFNFSIDGGSNYNVTKTTTTFYAIHSENDATATLSYHAAFDLAQNTAYQGLAGSVGNTSDESVSGIFRLFNPSSTTFVKHYITENQYYNNNTYSQIIYGAGYGNTTSAVDAIQFKMSTGNIDAGDICLYGIS